VSKWPMIAVPSGGSVERTVLLDDVYQFHKGKDYQITISAVLTLFVGDRDDADSELFPLRIPVFATSGFRW
jgi:hypothetical protein